MKKISTFFVALFVSTILLAQAPPAFNYQAVARNNAGVALANQTIQARLSILQGGTALYSETRSVTTNLLGLFNVQIGAAGAISTTGNFNTIQWLNNTPWISLKVELDISNTNVFTDMGTRPLSSVPYALAAETAKETKNLATRPLDLTTVPATGDVLEWNGTAWTPFTLPEQPEVGSIQTIIAGIQFGGATAPWVIVGNTATVTINGPQDKIIATGTASLGHNGAAPVPCSFSMCYRTNVAGSPITPFYVTAYPQATVNPQFSLGNPTRTNLSSTGVLTGLPAGSYVIGFGIKNQHSSINLNDNSFMTMSYQVIHY